MKCQLYHLIIPGSARKFNKLNYAFEIIFNPPAVDIIRMSIILTGLRIKKISIGSLNL